MRKKTENMIALRMTRTEFIDSNDRVIALRRSRTPDELINKRIDKDEKMMVRAFNSYDALLRAVKFTRNVIDNACGQLTGDEARLIHSMVVKAIAKAEGK